MSKYSPEDDSNSSSLGAVHLVLDGQILLVFLAVLSRKHQDFDENEKTHSIKIFSFTENDCFSLTESLCVQISLSSVTISKLEKKNLNPVLLHHNRKLVKVLEKLHLTIVSVDDSMFSRNEDVEHDLEILTGSSTVTCMFQDRREQCFQCFGCLIDQFGLMAGDFDGKCYVEAGIMGSCMRLDAAAIEAVNLFPTTDKRLDHFSSIYGILNFTLTKMGDRLLESMIRQPLLDIVEINNRLDLVELFSFDSQLRDNVRSNSLRGVADIDAIIARFIRYARKPTTSSSALQDMHKMYCQKPNFDNLNTCLSSCVDQLRSNDSRLSDNQVVLIRDRFQSLISKIANPFALYCQLVEKVIDFSQLPNYCVIPQHNQDLENIHDEIVIVEDEAKVEFGKLNVSNLNPKLETDNQYGFVFRTTKAVNEKELNRLVRNIRILQVLKTGIKFTTSALSSLSSRYMNLKEEYDKTQQQVVRQAVSTASTYIPMFEQLSRLLSQIDVVQSLAMVSCQSSSMYCRPVLHPMGSGIIDIVDGRHPCVEKSPIVSCFIPNSYHLAKQDSSFHIITGPNMGGKSTYIRALGCILVMAQIGSFVPCTSAEISIIDCLLARIGSSDCQSRGVSTFMAEMLDMSAILKTATSNSLVLIDELGRGTSTSDGFGLAVSISEYILTEINCFCLFASHFHELTSLESRHDQVKNYHMTATMDRQRILFLYQILPGCSGQSWGIQIIEHVGFPDRVIVDAKRKADELERSNDATDDDDHKKSRRERMIRFVNMPIDDMTFQDAIDQCKDLIN